jgi:hypothetical protein
MTVAHLIRVAGVLLLMPSSISARQVACSREAWEPTKELLQQILSDHKRWLLKLPNDQVIEPYSQARNTEGRANLCNASLHGIDLTGAALAGANLNGANLFSAHLDRASLTFAELNNAELSQANLNNANLGNAGLNGAILVAAKLANVTLAGAELKNSDLTAADLTGANLTYSKLDNARLFGANLTAASLWRVSIDGTHIDYVNLTAATYAPWEGLPSSYVGIKGLGTVKFPEGEEIGLVQLRDLLQKAGLRDGEREATYAIENGKTTHQLAQWKKNLARGAEGIFRTIAFGWTSAYGLHPGRALLLIVALWVILIPIYAWAIRFHPKRSPNSSGIYRIWPKDRVEVREGKPTLDNPATVDRLSTRGVAVVGWAAYFSLLSTFQIGFREFTVGTWLSRVQARSFVLESRGWIRTLSGFQSLVSVYLLALWILTYFGRPFQ